MVGLSTPGSAAARLRPGLGCPGHGPGVVNATACGGCATACGGCAAACYCRFFKMVTVTSRY